MKMQWGKSQQKVLEHLGYQVKAFTASYESRQPSVFSHQPTAFMLCCARQGMGVYMKVLSGKC
jgi:hypothetical protein